MAKKTKWIKTCAIVMIIATILSTVFTLCLSAWNASDSEQAPFISLFDGNLDTQMENYLDSSVFFKLPDTVKDTDEISVIISMGGETLLDAYENTDQKISIAEYAQTDAAKKLYAEIASEKQSLISKLDLTDIEYITGKDYDTVLRGFEVVIKAGDFDALNKALSNEAKLIVGDVYESADTQLVENTVNVHDTGIFNSANFGYDGTGIVVAVLDTGLDYTHTAFLPENFGNNGGALGTLGLTRTQVAALISRTTAAGIYSGLSVDDVYLNDKVPFSFDYADQDPDVFPIKSEHGTHVSGIIVGNDETIKGVAPNAQLVSMKVFSDKQDSARTSWILDALEDCVLLEVDVINMSLGVSCGFNRTTDKDAISGVYDRIRETGISLVVAASNDYNSTYGSEKNGNLGLTSNPDSATVGSPSTYDSSFSVASISGVKTPYFLYNGTIIYFTESSDRFAEERNFFEEILAGGTTELSIEYVTIPGVGRSADYTGIDITGKIALVKRGDTTFEEKANIAQAKGAAGVIIYNNVSGDIKMSIGEATIPVCSIRQDDGEMLAAAKTGTLKISTQQTSGPFMSDFSSWGPAPNLSIKPEITAHGGSILSAVPGQDYDRLSGTSMAAPNVAGLSALVRQYVIENFPGLSATEVTAFVNQLFMSTADIVFNTNGLPYSVRKQGAGLANLVNTAATDAIIITYDREDNTALDKTKIELGDDPTKTGVYELKFSVKNFGTTTLNYNVSAYVMTEGVSDTLTNDGETTVTEQGYILSNATVVVSSVTNGTQNGNAVSVAAGTTADVTVTITLGAEDKKYLDDSFENGMYVEGFVVLDSPDEGVVDLSAPYLAFYGDWTEAPLFDLDYFETNKDEIDDSIDLLDKTLPDAYATKPVGGTELDYINYLGSYYFVQDPSNKLIAADRKYISLSNQTDAVNSLRYVYAGLLRNAAKVDIIITEDATGEVIFERTEEDIRKSHNSGGAIYPASIDIEFSAIENNLKNNTAYTVTLTGYVDYGDGGLTTNDNNTFTFPLVTDFEAPTITGCEFYTEYDRVEKSTRLFAKIAIYDNHYAMAAQVGYVGENQEVENEETDAILHMFGKHLTPIYSEKNSTSYIVYELTDYIEELKAESMHKNTFTVVTYDYALNQAYYEIALPDDYTDFYFTEEETGLTLNPYEVYDLTPLAYPGTEWTELLEYSTSNPEIAKVVGTQLIPLTSGTVTVIATDPNDKDKTASFELTVRGEGDEGYIEYDKPVAESFTLTGYFVDKAFYFLSSSERDIGVTDYEMQFSGSSYALEMFPSEAVTLRYQLAAYFPDTTELVFESSNEDIVSVDENGKITAIAEGFASISVRVLMDNKSTFYSQSISITVKEPFVNSGAWLTGYYGTGDDGVVTFPDYLVISEINQYAFSGYDYVEKGPEDEISEDDPYTMKITYIGNDDIKKVILPEGIEKIGAYAFAGLTALEEIVLPSTLVTIDRGAFEGCTSLQKVTGIENVKFINQDAFKDCDIFGELKLNNTIAIADNAFINNKSITEITFSEATKSIGAHTFEGCTGLKKIITGTNENMLGIDNVKLGQSAFAGCSSLTSLEINSKVISASAFNGCTSLKNVTIGASVETIGESAFNNTSIDKFNVKTGNTVYKSMENGEYLTDSTGTVLLLVAPTLTGFELPQNSTVTTINEGAFSGNTRLVYIDAPTVVNIGAYAFRDCIKLNSVILGKLESLGEYAFYNTAIESLSSIDLSGLDKIADYAFAYTMLKTVTIPEGMKVGTGAFSECHYLHTVVVEDNVAIGEKAFMLDGIYPNFGIASYEVTDEHGKTETLYYYYFVSPLTSLTIGKNVKIGDYAFCGAAALTSVTLGEGAEIGDYAFFSNVNLREIDLSKVKSIGNYAFSGYSLYEYTDPEMETAGVNGLYYRVRYYSAKLQNVVLTSATSIGEGAFANNKEITSVTFGDGIDTIPTSAFYGCEKLAEANLSGITVIGNSAFAETALTTVDLSAATTVDQYAFAYIESLENVKFGSDIEVELGEGAFFDCTNLSSVTNSKSLTSIGKYAFRKNALSAIDLTGAVSIGTGAFEKSEATEFAVTLGDKLETLGDNPFAFCILDAFTSVEKETFNGKDYETTITTFHITDNILVIDGSIYRIVKNGGYELVTYAGDSTAVNIAEGTVRISDYAFAGTGVSQIVIPYTIKSIGHKAFYGCESLSLITFTSYRAPILEEEYDIMYFFSYENLPATGDYPMYADGDGNPIPNPGLGIIPYFMWNVSYLPTNIFYGANFSDYVGHVDSSIAMIYPENGIYYDTFVLDQYFKVQIEGETAAMDDTLAAIEAISKLPDRVSLADKPLVEAARAAYNKIATISQQALVKDYTRLTDAEKRIQTLEYLEDENQGGDNSGSTEPEPTPPTTDPEPKSLSTGEILAIIFGAAFVLAAAAAVVFAIPYFKSKKNGTVASDTPSVLESDEPLADEDESAAAEESAEEVAEATDETESDSNISE